MSENEKFGVKTVLELHNEYGIISILKEGKNQIRKNQCGIIRTSKINKGKNNEEHKMKGITSTVRRNESEEF